MSTLCCPLVYYDSNGPYCLIDLTQGFSAKVDPQDYSVLSQYNWSLQTGSQRTNYAARGVSNPNKKNAVIGITMHRQIFDLLESSDPNITVDHINGDGLDNRRQNLRLANRQQQAINRPLRSDNNSGQKGVYWFWLNKEKTRGKWRAQIKHEGKRKSLGLYENLEDAAAAYEDAAERYYGEWRRSKEYE